MMNGRDSIKPGGLNDPVAQNLRAEMNRDAMPSPGEAKREHRKWLKKQGCREDECDVDDPDELSEIFPHTHSCKGVQSPPVHPEVVCEEHRPEDIWESKIQERFECYRDNPDVVGIAIYDCDIIEPIRRPDPPTMTVTEMTGRDDEGNPTYEEVEVEDTRQRVVPSVDLQHVRCGSDLLEYRLYEDYK